MQSPIWVLPGPFPHRGNAHPTFFDTHEISRVPCGVGVVVCNSDCRNRIKDDAFWLLEDARDGEDQVARQPWIQVLLRCS
jgi:hypothetical protein